MEIRVRNAFLSVMVWGTVFVGGTLPLFLSSVGVQIRRANEIEGFIVGSTLLLCLSMLLLNRRVSVPRDGLSHIMLLTLLWGVFGGLIGVLRGWPMSYVVGDVFNTAVIPMSFIITAAVIERCSETSWRTFLGALVGAVMSKLVATWIFADQVLTERVTLSLLALVIVTGQYRTAFRTLQCRLLAGLLFVILMFHQIGAARRAPVVAISLGVIFAQVLHHRNATKRVAAIGISVAIACVMMVSPLGHSVVGRLAMTVQPSSIYHTDISTYGRLSEVKYAWRQLASGGIMPILVGMGQGAAYANPEAELYARQNYVEPDTWEVHNIHVGPMAILYRQGLIGLTLWAILCFIVLAPLRLSSFRDPRSIIIRIAFFMEQLVFFTAYFFVGDPIWGICLGMLARSRSVPCGGRSGYMVGSTCNHCRHHQDLGECYTLRIRCDQQTPTCEQRLGC